MKRVFNLLLIVCGLVLAIHLVMTVHTERISGSRWSYTEDGRAALRALMNRQYTPFESGGDPANSALILNFTGNEDPVTTDLADSWIFFDFEGRGTAVNTAWVGPGLGFLVSDPQSGGLVSNGRQLFGNHTLDGDPRIMTGFEALARLDENGDGLIDQRDPGWSNLRVWLDKKPDGRVGDRELFRLEQLHIAALEVKPQFEKRVLPNGNYLNARSSFIYSNGRRGPLDEIFFQQRAGLREYNDGLTVSPEVSASVPDLKGRGLMRALREAMMQSPELRAVYLRYQKAATRQEQLALMDELLTAWSRAGEKLPSMAERIGDRYDLVSNCLDSLEPDQLQRLEVMEAWTGRYFYRLPYELYPGQELLSGVEGSETDGRELKITCPDERWQALFKGYDSLSRHIYEGLLKGTRLKRFYDAIDWEKKVDLSRAQALFEAEFAQDPEKALTDLLEFRLDLARNGRGAETGKILDDYIKGKVEGIDLSQDQQYLFDRFSNLVQAKKKAAEVQARPAEEPRESGEH